MNRFGRTATFISLICLALVDTLGAQLLPGQPNTPSPPNNATNVSLTKILTWRADRATNGYDIYFGTTTTPPKVASVMFASYAPQGMLASTKYFFRVVAKNGYGTTSSPLWNFTTGTSGGGGGTPVDCVVSAWSLKSFTAWSACTNGVRTRTETWARTVITWPQNGGQACPVLTEQRIGTQGCTPPPPSPGGVLLYQSHLTYEGAFRVPVLSGYETFAWGGTAIAYNPAHNSLFMVGHDWYQRVGEITIPTPVKATSVTGLPRATALQPATDVLKGKLMTIDGNTTDGVKIGGFVVLPGSLAVSAWSYYDAGTQKQTKSHFVTGLNFAALPTVTGPFQVGIGFQDMVPTDTTRIAGFVSGYMSTIPSVWQSVLGGTHLTGQGGGVSIVTRTSSGPSATVFTPAELGVPNSPTKLVMGYPSDTNNPASPLNHPALGKWGIDGGLYNGTQSFRGMVFPEGSRSILFFGWTGDKFCYGAGTADPALHGQPNPQGGVFCYDPPNQSKGTHGYPYRSLVFAYDANDFLAVRYGQKLPWEIKPYATWKFTLPFQQRIVGGVDFGEYAIVGAAYDSAGKRIFLSAIRNDGAEPLIHVFKLP